LCGMETEGNFHPFIRCNIAKQLWFVRYGTFQS
jgi:hypothetical protein